MTNLADERRYRRQHPQPVHANNSVRRTYDLIRGTLRTLEPEATLSEGDLVDRFSASRNTIRIVLRLLASQGLVSRGPKVGTIVSRSTVVPFGELTPLAEWSKRATIRGMVLESKVIPAFAAIRQRLELPEGASVAVTEGVVLEGDEPLALFVSYVELSPEQAQLLGEDGLSVIAFLEKHLGVFVVESDAVMTALACDKQTSELLHIPEGSPILLIEDLLRDADARPWAVCQLRCRADRMAFSATARRRAH